MPSGSSWVSPPCRATAPQGIIGPASWKCLLHFESTLERQAQGGAQGWGMGRGCNGNILSALEEAGDWRGCPRGFGLFFFIGQEVFIGPTNKHLGVVVGLGQ